MCFQTPVVFQDWWLVGLDIQNTVKCHSWPHSWWPILCLCVINVSIPLLCQTSESMVCDKQARQCFIHPIPPIVACETQFLKCYIMKEDKSDIWEKKYWIWVFIVISSTCFNSFKTLCTVPSNLYTVPSNLKLTVKLWHSSYAVIALKPLLFYTMMCNNYCILLSLPTHIQSMTGTIKGGLHTMCYTHTHTNTHTHTHTEWSPPSVVPAIDCICVYVVWAVSDLVCCE